MHLLLEPACGGCSPWPGVAAPSYVARVTGSRFNRPKCQGEGGGYRTRDPFSYLSRPCVAGNVFKDDHFNDI